MFQPFPACLSAPAGQSGKTILSNFNELYNASAADRAAQGQFPFSVTEFNAKTSGDFSTSTSNMDTPSQAVKLVSWLGASGKRGSSVNVMCVMCIQHLVLG